MVCTARVCRTDGGAPRLWNVGWRKRYAPMPQCMQIDPQDAARNAAQDLRLAIDFARGLPQVDATHIVAAGVSTGGLATVALTANAPPGLMAAINFAGGTGSRADHDVPNAGEVIGAYRGFGKTARIPNFGSMPRTTSTSGPSLHKSLTRHFVPRAA